VADQIGQAELDAISRDLERIALQERVLFCQTFDEGAAWRLGGALREAAEAASAPIVVELRSHERLLFGCAMPGSSPDNWEWARRKSNITHRFHRSSYALGLELRAAGAAMADRGLDAADYAVHGGSFPIRAAGAGFLGSITVSGLPQREDHNLIVAVLSEYLRKDPVELALPPPA
jgi:uncharacterized protein (UPF0303 family)